MGAIMTAVLKLEVFYGVPMCRSTASYAKDSRTDELIDALDAVSFWRVGKTRAGFFDTPDGVADRTELFGVHVATVDLHHHSHHIDLDEIPRVTTEDKRAYRELLAKQSPQIRAFIKKVGKGQPRRIAVLVSRHTTNGFN